MSLEGKWMFAVGGCGQLPDKSLRLKFSATPLGAGKPKEHHPAPPKHPGKQLKDLPPRQPSQALWFLHSIPHYEWLMQQPAVSQGYDPSPEVGPKSHTTIIVPSG
ncbi:hypothetical protein AVEN_241171-1 [Araneus ventricosus]|uniref:Uncharacterized protein n=1 Tax=Araneus ventricosus TaxID=182803 RepID=A0A4Y2FZI2_ARAVE|nr:hypothetical protein AVEN_241171-1 [Araneus ventricosus]